MIWTITNALPDGSSWRIPWVFYLMIDSLMAVSRALYCCTDAHLADGAVLGSGEAGEEAGFSALISSLAGETPPNERHRALCEFARLTSSWPRLPRFHARAKNHRLSCTVSFTTTYGGAAAAFGAHLSAAAVRTRPSATSPTAGSTMNDFCPPSGEPGLFAVFTSTRARDGVPRVPESRPNILKFIDFDQATISGRRQRRGAPVQRREPLDSVVSRPSTSFRTEIGCIAGFALNSGLVKAMARSACPMASR